MFLTLLLSPALAEAPTPAAVEPAAVEAMPPAKPRPFEQPFAVGTYAAVRGGSYTAAGVGGKVRIQPFRRAGLDLYLEATGVEWPGGFRHDYPNGFSLFTAVTAGPVQIRPYFGFCDVVSLVEPTQPGAPRADDVMLGAHLGLGADLAVARAWTIFADGQVDAYAGHDRSSGGWTGNVAEDLIPVLTAQLNVGVQLHLADPR